MTLPQCLSILPPFALFGWGGVEQLSVLGKPGLLSSLLTCTCPPACRHKEDVYENLHGKSKKEEKVKKQQSADKEKSKGSLKRK